MFVDMFSIIPVQDVIKPIEKNEMNWYGQNNSLLLCAPLIKPGMPEFKLRRI